MQKRFKTGDSVFIDTDNDQYREYLNKELMVTHVATKYMKAREFFDNGKPNGFHPGFDNAGAALYDLEYDGTEVPFSLYDWELR